MNVAMVFPWSIWDCWWLAPLALALDILLGDPALPWKHPVCWLGILLNKLEIFSRRLAAYGKTEKYSGSILFVCGLLSLFFAGFLAFMVVFILVRLPGAGAVFAIYFAWSGLAMGCLLRTGKEVLKRIETGSPVVAREAVSWLVSRETGKMDRQLLRKTLADTLAENFTDAFLAPWFWLLFTGPCGLWFYKLSSTMDSQWGYKTPQWEFLGKSGARCDDLLAFLPARISIWALYCANLLMNCAHLATWRGEWPGYVVIAGQARGMPSPNSGWSMAACAWLCGCRMAGPSVYFGELVPKPWLGPLSESIWNRESLEGLCNLLFWGTMAGGVLLWLVALFLRYVGEIL